MQVKALLNGGQSTELRVAPGWADYNIPLPPGTGEPGSTLTLEITGPTWRMADYVPDTNDPRSLGVGIDSIALLESP